MQEEGGMDGKKRRRGGVGIARGEVWMIKRRGCSDCKSREVRMSKRRRCRNR